MEKTPDTNPRREVIGFAAKHPMELKAGKEAQNCCAEIRLLAERPFTVINGGIN